MTGSGYLNANACSGDANRDDDASGGNACDEPG
jgi:hypothetical protein